MTFHFNSSSTGSGGGGAGLVVVIVVVLVVVLVGFVVGCVVEVVGTVEVVVPNIPSHTQAESARQENAMHATKTKLNTFFIIFLLFQLFRLRNTALVIENKRSAFVYLNVLVHENYYSARQNVRAVDAYLLYGVGYLTGRAKGSTIESRENSSQPFK